MGMLFWYLRHQGAFPRSKRGQYLDGNLVDHGRFHAAMVEHLGAILGKAEHFFIIDLLKFNCVSKFSGIFVINPVYIRVDPANIGLQKPRQRHLVPMW